MEAVRDGSTPKLSIQQANALHQQFEDRYRKFRLEELFEEANPEQRIEFDKLVTDVGGLINQLDDEIMFMDARSGMNRAASMEIDQ